MIPPLNKYGSSQSAFYVVKIITLPNDDITYNRSNGIVNVGFVMYHSMKTVATETILFVRSRRRRKGKKAKATRSHEDSNGKTDKGCVNGHSTMEGEKEDPIAVLWRICSGTLIPGMINVVLAVTPFAAFQGINWSNRLDRPEVNYLYIIQLFVWGNLMLN